MDIIIRAFNPEGGNARATSADICDKAVGLIIKGDDADAIIAKFHQQAPTIDLSDNWSGLSDLFDSLETTSPMIMFCYNKREAYNLRDWKECYHKNLGANPKSKAKMMGFYANTLLASPKLINEMETILGGFTMCKDVVLLSSAPYYKARDFNKLSRAIVDIYASLCYDKPEEHWIEAEELLHNVLGNDNAYILIVDADQCRKRFIWNVAEGEPTNYRLKIVWTKKGWSIGNDYDEHISDVVFARRGVVSYENFLGCITEITDEAITIRLGDKTETLTPGNTLEFRNGDSYEDHEGVEHYDITYTLTIEWLKE